MARTNGFGSVWDDRALPHHANTPSIAPNQLPQEYEPPAPPTNYAPTLVHADARTTTTAQAASGGIARTSPNSHVSMRSPVASSAQRQNGAATAGDAHAVDFEQLLATSNKITETVNTLRTEPPLETQIANGRTDQHAYQQFSREVRGYPLASVLRHASLPPLVQERYQREPPNTECYCGIAEPIGRAWASVGSALFIWRPGIAENAPVVYDHGGAPIVAVGWLKPMPNVFVSSVGHVAVVATALTVSFVGVCCSGGVDTCPEQIVLQALPLYSCPTNGALANCVTTTAKGRVFLGAVDGHLYEVIYGASDGAGAPSSLLSFASAAVARRCKVLNHTAGMLSLLPSVVPNLLPSFVSPKLHPVDQIVVDDERHYLYTRDSNGLLKVFDLGGDGRGSSVSMKSKFDLKSLPGIGRGGGNASRARGGDASVRAGEPTALDIVGMWPVPVAESRLFHLCVVPSDASRLFFSAARSDPTARGAQHPRPDRLEHRSDGVRQPPNYHVTTSATAGSAATFLGDAAAALGGTGGPATGPLVLAASGAGASASCILAEAGSAPGVLLLSRSPSAASRTAENAYSSTSMFGSAAHGMREGLVAIPTVGAACAVSQLRAEMEDTARGLLPGCEDWLAVDRRFAVITERETRVITETRPLGALSHLLSSGTCPSRQADPRRRGALEELFSALGRPEAAALCLALAAGLGASISASATAAHHSSGAVSGAARQCLRDEDLMGAPHIKEEGRAAPGLASAGGVGGPAPGLTSSSSTFDMGTAVVGTAAENLVYSGRYDGLRTAAARLLRESWDEPLFGVAGQSLSLGLAFRDAGEVRSLALTIEALVNVVDDTFEWNYGTKKTTAVVSSASANDRLSLGRYGVTFSGADNSARKRTRSAEAAEKEADGGRKVVAVLRRVTEVLRLVTLLQPLHPGRLALRLSSAERQSLANLTLKNFSSTRDGDGAIAQLCAAALDEANGAGADTRENLSLDMRRGCPSLFREEDRRFHEARRMLEKAREMPTSNVDARRKAAAEARRLLVASAVATDPDKVCPDLEALGEVEGVAELIAACARARASTDAEGAAACRAAVGNSMKRLSESGSVPEEGETRARALLLACAAQSDAALRSCAYAAAVQLRLDDAIVAASLSADDVQSWLAREGNLQMLQAGQIIDARCAHILRLLSRAKAASGELDGAASLLLDLAERKGTRAEGGMAVPSLEERESLLREAALHARAGTGVGAAGGGAVDPRFASAAEEASFRCQQFAAHCEARLKLLALQRRLVDHLSRGGASPPPPPPSLSAVAAAAPVVDNATLLSELDSEVVDISRLYYDVALPNRRYAECLELLSLSGRTGSEDLVTQLWDRLLKAEAKAAGGETASGALAAACSAAKVVGPAVLDASASSSTAAVSMSSIPLAHITMRLETLGAGLWPWTAPRPPAADAAAVVDAVVACAGGDAAAALEEGYDAYLRAQAPAGASADPRVRLRVLRSAKDLLRLCASNTTPDGAAYYADVASRWAREARQAGDPGDMAGESAAIGGGLEAIAVELRASAAGLGF